ncbi:HEAT repeat-containing protein 1 [Lamellibrachia satsuma]|nr:HEAT repeat-containing protein 1 [Lamellibrachia satsuma]
MIQDVFDVSIKILGESTTDAPPPPMIASALLCLAELCTTTKAHAIPYLSRFMPPLIATLNNRALLMGHELVLICALTALHRITSSLPHFLSPYLVDIILAVCQMSNLVSPADKLKKSQASIRLSGVRHQIATAVSPRVLVPALSDCYSRLLIDNHDGVLLLMEILRESIESMSKDDLAAQHNALVTLFCSVLDLCNAPQLRLSQTETDQVESAAIDAVLAMVVRLSENTFRPMFYKLYDWACREDSEEYKNRKLTFFRLAERLSERLKSLFNLFAGHIIKTATHMLDQNNSLHSDTPYFGADEPGTQKSCLVLGYIIGCLHKCMLYDTDGFVNSDMFKLLLQPLVDQLENFVGGDAAHEARVHDHATPCISQLAVTMRDDSAWKTLNYQILLKTRHNLPKVRFAALKTIEDLAQKLGDEYMSLVPETIPFLAELMEDESEEVEQLCQQVIASMEDVLGESLQKYF